MKRNLFDILQSHLEKREFTIITGARQTGKSTLLHQLEHDCKAKNIPNVFLNLENKHVLSEIDKNPLNILNFLPVADKRVVIFMDEIQYLEDPSNFLKLLYDEHANTVKIVATGSSAFYMDQTFKDSLAGRKRIFQLYTCSFDEYLKLGDKEDLYHEIKRIQENAAAKSLKIDLLQHEWNNYLVFGGYPAVITEPDRQEKITRLKEIRDSFVKRDILESGVQNETAFYNLFRIIAGQTGNLVNINELSATLKIKAETIKKYLFILQKCFHIALISPFTKNLRKELTKMPKAYLLDNGLRNCLLNNFDLPPFRFDKGELWENMYFRTLADKYDVNEIFFWRTTEGNEVDFVLNHIENPYAVEVKYDLHTIKESKYKLFRNTYPDIPLHFVWTEPFSEEFFRRQK